MEKLQAAPQDAPDQALPELDFRQLDSAALAELDGSALGMIVQEMRARKHAANAKHSSHSSYTQYSTYSMGPIGN